jgi:multidrug efflux pump subunit AcrA (membrane-fusion protein)
MRLIRSILRFALPVVILGGCIYVTWWLLSHPPEQQTMTMPPTVVRVEGTVLKRVSYALQVPSQGTVQPRTRSTLLPEVSGKIIEMSPSFRPGGFFNKDEVLLKLDTTDYETAIVIAKAELALRLSWWRRKPAPSRQKKTGRHWAAAVSPPLS